MFGLKMVATLALVLAGCADVLSVVDNKQKSATEERPFTAEHVVGSPVEVRAPVGAVNVTADPSVKEVTVTAKVTAYAQTEDEAKARLPMIKTRVSRRDDKTLEVVAEFPTEEKNFRGSCSFTVRVPGAAGAKVQTGNGSVTLKELGGNADIDTGIGSVTVHGQRGKVKAQSGNGSITVTGPARAEDDRHEDGSAIFYNVDVQTGIGAITVRDVRGVVSADTGNGSVTVANVSAPVIAKTSIGSITLDKVGGYAQAKTGNGSITFAATARQNPPFNLTTGIGSVKVTLPPSSGARIKADTGIGTVTVGGPRKPHSVSGGRSSKTIVLHEGAGMPAGHIHTGNGSITVTLDD